MDHPEFKPGFRVSWLDKLVLGLGTIIVILVVFEIPILAVVLAFVISHFFLFCNIVRMDRPLELIWAAIFLASCISTILTTFPGWIMSFGVALIATIILMLLQIRKASYHGVFWEHINPDLPKWWEDNSPD